MNPEKWQKVYEIFNDVLAMEPTARDPFIRAASHSDPEIIAELDKLLLGNARAEELNFLETAAWSFAQEETTEENLTGTKLDDRYVLTRKLDSGGMGDVYLATDHKLRREVAVKLVKEAFDRELLKLFKVEAHSLAQLNHPNVAHIYDYGEMAGGRPFIVMEYLQGVSLRKFLQGSTPGQQQAVAPELVAEITKQACAGLSAAHHKEIIHRDVKPENIFVTETEDGWGIKVIDFGIAVLKEGGTGTTYRQTQGFRGTVQYMSPEQADGKTGKELDARTDIYSLGLVIHEMLSGNFTFTGSVGELFYQHSQIDPKPPCQNRPELTNGAAIDRVVLKSLAKKPEARQQSIKELAQEFEEAANSQRAAVAVGNNNKRVLFASAASVFLLVLAFLLYQQMTRPNGAMAVPPATEPAPASTVGANNTSPTGTLPVTSSPTPANVRAATQPPESPLALSVRLQDKDGSSVSAGRTFHNGETVRLAVEPAQAGLIYILLKGSSNELSVLCPDKRINGGNNQFSGGKKIMIPPGKDSFKFDHRPGTETVYVLQTQDKNNDLIRAVEKAIAQSREVILDPRTKVSQRIIDSATGAALLAELTKRATELPTIGTPQITGPGPLVAVLNLRHEGK